MYWPLLLLFFVVVFVVVLVYGFQVHNLILATVAVRFCCCLGCISFQVHNLMYWPLFFVVVVLVFSSF